MQIIKSGVSINFVGHRKITFILSTILILSSLVSLIGQGGPKLGIDFAGGAEILVRLGSSTPINKIREALASKNLQGTVQQYGKEETNYRIIVNVQHTEKNKDLYQNIKEGLEKSTGTKVDIDQFEMVGPQVGQNLREKALLAMFYALLFITVYISGRFELKWLLSGIMATALATSVYALELLNLSIPWLMLIALIVALILFWILKLKYAMGAIVALMHDITITIGLFSIFDKEFNLPIIAALLTIIGYSLNDTIIVFDRIRENLRKYHRLPLAQIINKSVNETLNRTILTSLTTLIVVLCLFVYGGVNIHDFAFALIVGVMIGTYSSIFVASPILMAWQQRK
ncbi:MAG: protein translocase subunit SecF [Desulfobacteraceae bacterium]|nr:protein translocase subunit SecF [Desulfobacteraceae bacterium]